MSFDMTGIQARTDSDGGQRYRARVKDQGKYVYGPWRTNPADARGDRIRMQAQKLDGPLRKDHGGPTIQQLSEQFLTGASAGTVLSRRKTRYSPATVRGYEQAFKHWINPELGQIAVASLRRSQVQRWVDWMVPQKAGDTVRNNWSALAALYRWYLRRSDLDDLVDPTEGIDLPSPGKPRERYADRAEIPAYLDALPEELQLPFALAFYAGLRHAEIQALKWEDIDGNWIRVERSFDARVGFKLPKSGKPRDVPVFAPLMPYLDLTATGFVVPALRTSRWGVQMLGRSYAEKCERAWRQAGLEPLGLHEARHSFATAAIRAGYDPRTVQEWMGHADSKTTMRIYAKERGRQAGLADLMNDYLGA